MLKANQAAGRSDKKRCLLRCRIAKVAAASTIVASCLMMNAAARKRKRARVLREAVAMVSLVPCNVFTTVGQVAVRAGNSSAHEKQHEAGQGIIRRNV